MNAMLVDLHTHTAPASSCSRMTADEYVAACVGLGVHAIALTNHGDASANAELETRLAELGIVLVHGVEISTLFGDFVLLSPDLDYLSTLRDVQEVPLRGAVPEHAAVVWVHPAAGGGRSGSVYFPGLAQNIAPIVDAVEVYNGNWLAPRYVQEAESIAEALGLPRVGGSDAHDASQIMACATEVDRAVASTADVVDAIKRGRVSPWRRPETARRRLGLFGRGRK
jgi:predicted metal-dependent phosphoesterase TrpH